MKKSIPDLINTLPQTGELVWIGLRTERKKPLKSVPSVDVTEQYGLEGDHYSSMKKDRQVTLIQQEHLETVASCLHLENIDPGLVRRNIVVKGINLLALKGLEFKIGNVILFGTGLCHPCSRMEENLGAGGYNAMRGHGGITAKVIRGGTISLKDEVSIA